MAAVKNGQALDTTMGFTPASGLPMSRRSGDLDPGLVSYLARTEGMTVERFHKMVNTESGLLGVSELSSDMRDLLTQERSDPRAAEAVALFCYQAGKVIGALAAVLGGIDSLVFSAGIGEHSPAIRARICAGLEFLGIDINEAANETNQPVISSEESRVKVRVIPTDEEREIAESVARLLGKGT
jgi:acetate kinase